MHALAYVTFAPSLVHGLMTGSDTGSPWALAFYAAALRWEDFELDGPRPTITIQHSADTRKQTRVSTAKTGEERRVRIGSRMVEVLKRHHARQLEERMKASSWEDSGLVFPNRKGKIRRRDSVMRSLRRYLEEAGLPAEICFHDLRHTAGTLALRQGVPLHTVSRMLGYSDPAMTLRRYAHVLEDMREDAVSAMDELFLGHLSSSRQTTHIRRIIRFGFHVMLADDAEGKSTWQATPTLDP